MREQFKHDFKRGEWCGSPVDGDKRKESMLNLVPFAGSRRVMNNGDPQLFFIGQVLQLLLPQAVLHPIGPTPIGGDQYLLLLGIEGFATGVPPSSDALHGELSGLMIDADIDKAPLVDQIIDSIGDRTAC